MQDNFTVWAISVVLSLAIGAVAIAFRKQARTSSHPAVIFAIMWCAMTLLPIVGVPELVVSPYAVAYILAGVIAFGIPVYFQRWQPDIEIALGRRDRPSPFKAQWLLFGLIVIQILPVVFLAINVRLQGFNPSDLIFDPLNIGEDYLGARYSGAVESNILSQAGTVLNYIGAGLGGLLAVSRKSLLLRLLVFVLVFFPSTLNVLIYADKGTIFLTGAFFFGGVLVARIATGNLALVTRNTLLVGPIVLIVIALLMALAMLNRTVNTQGGANRTLEVAGVFQNIIVDVVKGPKTAEEVTGKPTGTTTGDGKMPVEESGEVGSKTTTAATTSSASSGLLVYGRSYAFGHLFAFSDWFEHWVFDDGTQTYQDPAKPTWGFWTFMAVGAYVMPEYRDSLPAGYFAEYYSVPDKLYTNIYTMFRGAIYDYTLAGSIVFMLIAGWISGKFYRNMLIKESPAISQAFFILFIGYVYTSYIISLLIWRSVYACTFGILVILLSAKYARSENLLTMTTHAKAWIGHAGLRAHAPQGSRDDR